MIVQSQKAMMSLSEIRPPFLFPLSEILLIVRIKVLGQLNSGALEKMKDKNNFRGLQELQGKMSKD
jgi:hypothetical protein